MVKAVALAFIVLASLCVAIRGHGYVCLVERKDRQMYLTPFL
jgi:hypothetical protein